MPTNPHTGHPILPNGCTCSTLGRCYVPGHVPCTVSEANGITLWECECRECRTIAAQGRAAGDDGLS